MIELGPTPAILPSKRGNSAVPLALLMVAIVVALALAFALLGRRG